MSRYPDDCPGRSEVMIDMQCESCGHEWTADCWEDLAQVWLKNDSDEICPECSE